MHRTQKLLHRDYKSIKDVILLESAFAETTKCGLGIRQVYLALSAQNLFIAADDVGSACNVAGGEEMNYISTRCSSGQMRNYIDYSAAGGNKTREHKENSLALNVERNKCTSSAQSVGGKNYRVRLGKEKRVTSEPCRNVKNYIHEPLDPAIESLRLLSLFPLDCVCLHVYRER